MTARQYALVPLSAEQQAAWQAVAETEKRRHQGNTLAEYPYAGAFFRCLNGSRRISLSDLRFFMPSLTAEELRGNRLQWLYAVDVLIETQGEVCLLPLPGDAADRLFPSVRFRVRERSRHKSALVMQKYSRQQAREAEDKARMYQSLVAQAEIELAFHTPETVGSWLSRWSGSDVPDYELESLFWRWSERFPSLAGFERGLWQDVPLWRVVHEAGLSGREASAPVRELERWMVPNKLREVA
ncbi:TPA: plasmid SOS inhibition protein A [Salmonella enterica]|nr:plasmid SOS inhibition protein A [Salmonella enterica]